MRRLLSSSLWPLRDDPFLQGRKDPVHKPQIKSKQEYKHDHDQGRRTNLLPIGTMYQLHFLFDLAQKFKKIPEATEHTGVFGGSCGIRILSILLGQETRFLPGVTSFLSTRQQAETL
jgi:hypothetical protein